MAVAGLSLMALPAQAATTFITNTSGNASALNGVSSGDSTPLTLSAADGGGTITLTTINTSGNTDLNMDGNSLGHGNDKWGANQNWTFSFDQTISFDGLSFETPPGGQPMVLRSAAWKDDADASGTGWSFSSDGTLGTFALSGDSDFTSAGVSDVAAGTSIGFGYFGSTTGGTELSSFTIGTIIPEPSSTALLGLGGLALILRRRK